MIYKVSAKIMGNTIIDENVKIPKRSYTISVEKDAETNSLLISFSLKVKKQIEKYIPTISIKNGCPFISFPENEKFSEIIQLMQHIESFGAFDIGIEKITWETPIIEWINEDGDEIISPITKIERKMVDHAERVLPRQITDTWLHDVIDYSKMMGDLYLPFSFFREGSNLFHQARYQSAFISYYLMLEYFFHEDKGYTIHKTALTKYPCLNYALQNTLNGIKETNKDKLDWLSDELKKKNKLYNVEGLLYILNNFRNELSHASEKDLSRSCFNEEKYHSLAYITMMVCMFVQIKKRLLPFVTKDAKEDFLAK